MADPTEERCHCGRPLHYASPLARHLMEELVRRLGPFVTVVDSRGRRWRVPRHYLALHALREQDLASLGFEQLPAGCRLPPAS